MKVSWSVGRITISHGLGLGTLVLGESILVCWQNYNKSRIHSSRGARNIEITLDGRLIFVGEIARASGDVVGTSDSFGDVCLM